ncbi:hypothetical protein MHF_0408 [Mycoplasma haemofelis Ohio2]|uniref:Uncharacterized protein n=1 Tax=Mycoplasma haemofelis (strain Ohio2) TaxID=859194 RepID=F6FH79_MYCHI|nr:hypothetical protein MHF_0408 [Mycoplasma haemofelis Ohio2]
MSKLIPASLGAMGVSGAGVGSYIYLTSSENKKEEKVMTFKEKYSHAPLDLEGNTNDTIWSSKLTALKTGSPHHPDLISAKNAITPQGEDKAKPLHKEACRKIYGSSSDNQDYFHDFKKYCSKLLGDLVTGTWISSDSNSNSSWDGKLNDLISKKSELVSQTLKSFAESLKTGSLTEEQRKTIKDWCSTQKDQLFSGEGDNVIQEIKSYCTSN